MPVNLFSDTTLDLWKVTQKAQPWKGQYETLRKYNSYPMLGRIFRGKGVKEIQGGSAIEWQTVLDDTGNAQFVTPHEAVEYDTDDVVGTFSANWALCHGSHLVSEDEIEQNSATATQLQDLRKIKREVCSGGMFNKVESQAWKVPTGSAEDQAKQPFGIPYSVVPVTSAQVAAGNVGGFYGQNASGFTSCYGVDSSLDKYARYRNYVDVWSNSAGEITEDDVDKVLQMLRYLNWQGPMNAAEAASGDFANLVMYTTNKMIKGIDRKARENNDNLGADLGKFAGQSVTRGIPYVWSQALEEVSNATNPVVAVDHSVLQCLIHSGENFREFPAKRLEDRPRLIATDVYLKYQLTNRNRRRCGRIDYVA
jgi:hypothetical protein